MDFIHINFPDRSEFGFLVNVCFILGSHPLGQKFDLKKEGGDLERHRRIKNNSIFREMTSSDFHLKKGWGT